MTKRRHKSDTKTFTELTFEEQAKSISANIMNLSKAIRNHITKAAENNRNKEEVKIKCIAQLARMIVNLEKK